MAVRNLVHPETICPSCGAALSIPGGRLHGKFRCPKCLDVIALTPGSARVDGAPVPPRPEQRAAAVPRRTGRDTSSRESPSEPDTAHIESEELDEEVRKLRAERDRLARRLRSAESALHDAAQLLERFSDMEQRITDMGQGYVKSACRIAELEAENAGLRGIRSGVRPPAGTAGNGDDSLIRS